MTFQAPAEDIRNMRIIAVFCALLFDFHKGVVTNLTEYQSHFNLCLRIGITEVIFGPYLVYLYW